MSSRSQRDSFESEWVPGPDGIPFRRAGRVLLFDEADRLLLVRGHDVAQPSRSWWFTIGGGILPGESPAEGAARELREETGIVLAPDALEGPVFTRDAIFDFQTRPVRQLDHFFFAHIAGADSLDVSGWDEVEREFMDELRWFDLDDLAAVTIEVFPGSLVDLARGLLGGWDGVTRDISDLEPGRPRP